MIQSLKKKNKIMELRGRGGEYPAVFVHISFLMVFINRLLLKYVLE